MQSRLSRNWAHIICLVKHGWRAMYFALDLNKSSRRVYLLFFNGRQENIPKQRPLLTNRKDPSLLGYISASSSDKNVTSVLRLLRKLPETGIFNSELS